MKKIVLLCITACLIVLNAGKGFSQNPEFERTDNGLMYSNNTISQLKHIVDSLNLRFKVCDLSKEFYAIPQAKAHYITIEKKQVLAAKADIDHNISFDEFAKKYAQAKIEKDVSVLKYISDSEQKKKILTISSISFKNDEHEIKIKNDISKYLGSLKGKWIYEYNKKTSYSDEELSAFYFTEDFESKKIPEKYAKMVQYADCMIDTSTVVFFPNAKHSDIYFISTTNKKSSVEKFIDYIAKKTGKPDYNTIKENEWEAYKAKFSVWDSLKFIKIDSLKAADKNFIPMFNEALAEAKVIFNTNDEFETYVAHYDSPATALFFKRNRKVVGGCSMDQGPRIHAMNIAILAAQTANWSVFLKAHLDIMNDRFERVSDGSYAWGLRNTYIKEIELLNLNITDLLLGICFRYKNPSTNHYFGGVGRIGRAMAESKDSLLLENTIIDAIKDNSLDDFNRVIMYFLFTNYNYYIQDKAHQELNKTRLSEAVKNLLPHLSSKIKL